MSSETLLLVYINQTRGIASLRSCVRNAEVITVMLALQDYAAKLRSYRPERRYQIVLLGSGNDVLYIGYAHKVNTCGIQAGLAKAV